jgi:hypothetical protein
VTMLRYGGCLLTSNIVLLTLTILHVEVMVDLISGKELFVLLGLQKWVIGGKLGMDCKLDFRRKKINQCLIFGMDRISNALSVDVQMIGCLIYGKKWPV